MLNEKKVNNKVRVSDFVASYIASIGINDVFLVSGGGMMYLLDGLKCNKDINIICAHNEAAAAVMAEGYSRVSENLGVVFVTTGPGATNAITGAVDAWVDSIPMLVISGQCKRSQNVHNSGISGLRSLGGQEVDILPIVQSITKFSEMVNDPQKIKYYLQKAIYHAKSGRPGPSWLDIPLDVQSSLIDVDDLEDFIPDKEDIDQSLIERQIDEAARLLQLSQRPIIIAGNGVRLSGAGKEFLELMDTARVPMVSSKLGQDLIDDSHPYYVGFGGSKGTRAGNLAIQNADLILSIGCRLAIPFIGYEYDLFARGAKNIAVDIDHRELIKPTIKLDVAINCDARLFIKKLMSRLSVISLPERKEWVDKCRHWKEKYNSVPEGLSRTDSPACSYNLFDKLGKLLGPRAVVIADAGSIYCIISQAFKVKYGQRVITPACLGTMGLSLPLGIGACYAAKNATVVAVTGDGSLQMNIQELQTLVHNKVPLKLFVVNNNGYLSIRNSQDTYFESRYAGSDPGSGVSCPDLKKIAHAYGITYDSIHDQTELDAKLEGILSHEGPIICEVYTDMCQKIIPSISTKQMADGRLVSAPLEDMWPFLPDAELKKEMIIEPVNYSK